MNASQGSLISIRDAENLIRKKELDKWREQVVTEVRERILRKDYPCVFTRVGYEKNHLQFSFLEDPFDQNSLRLSFNDVIDFIDLVDQADSPQTAAMKTLLLCVNSTELSSHREPAAVWSILNAFLEFDVSPWPAGVPKDPENPEWAYCLLGKRAFITVLSPSHKKRRSRNLGSHMVLLFQLRDGIEYVAPYNSKGNDVRETIRRRIEAYDEVPLAPDMTTHGEERNKDWSQYWLGDGMEPFQGKCPLHQKK
ncbi:YqcI/YcgG family protein [Pseudomonas aeruginosa]|uniref:YqcI/YcgG family protein n=1 Tax=Pseudomonas aeruginosa TaxID=287 RepID=UPI0009A5FB38|nr:YqcI/YcgG family protein [Pseudomonas aeruginosa]